MRYVSFFLTFMLLVGPRFHFPDLNILFTAILVLIFPFTLYKYNSMNKELLAFFLLIILFFIASLISSILTGAVNYSSLTHSINTLAFFLSSWSLINVYLLYSPSNFKRYLANDIALVYLVNAFFIVAVMFFPAVKSFAILYLSQDEKMIGLAQQSIRSFDMVMGGGAITSIVYSVVFTFSLICYLEYKKTKYLMCSIFSIVAMLFTGRTGVVLSIAFFFPTLIFYNFICKKTNYVIFATRQVLTFVLYIFLGMVFIYFISLAFYLDVVRELSDKMFQWAFEPLINYIETGSFSSSSTASLSEMYSGLELSELFSFFGTSLNGRDGYYLETDVGYYRALFTSGIVGLLLIYGKYIYAITLALLKAKYKSVNMEIAPYIVGVVYYCLAILITNFKEYHEAVRSGTPLLFLLIITITIKGPLCKRFDNNLH